MIDTMTTAEIVLVALATARVTRLVTADKLTERPRLWVLTQAIRWRGEDSLLTYLLTCAWCVSVYVGAGAATLWYVAGDTRIFTACAAALAFSYVTGWLTSRESE